MSGLEPAANRALSARMSRRFCVLARNALACLALGTAAFAADLAQSPAPLRATNSRWISGGLFTALESIGPAGTLRPPVRARAAGVTDLSKGQPPAVLDVRVGVNVRLGDAPAALPANPGDPLDGIRRDLSGRLQALRERVDEGIPWKKAERLSAVDSARTLVAQVPSVETALARAVQAWRTEWIRSRSLDSSTGLLPRPEGEPRQGRILVYGSLGGWYVSTDGSLRGALLKSGPGSTWEWREDLSDSASASVAALGSGALLPMDPELGPPEGAGFFKVQVHSSWKERLAKFADFRQGPLHLVGLLACFAVAAYAVTRVLG